MAAAGRVEQLVLKLLRSDLPNVSRLGTGGATLNRARALMERGGERAAQASWTSCSFRPKRAWSDADSERTSELERKVEQLVLKLLRSDLPNVSRLGTGGATLNRARALMERGGERAAQASWTSCSFRPKRAWSDADSERTSELERKVEQLVLKLLRSDLPNVSRLGTGGATLAEVLQAIRPWDARRRGGSQFRRRGCGCAQPRGRDRSAPGGKARRRDHRSCSAMKAPPCR